MAHDPLPPLHTLSLSALTLHEELPVPTDGTGKRKIDGNYAETRLGKAVTSRWANERFRQVMLLVREFRIEWPNQSLLSNDDVEILRMAVDNALATAEREGHIGDIYDLNPTTWAIWLVQHTHATRNGSWTADSVRQQASWSFEALYSWLEIQHERGDHHNLYDHTTRQLLHRYKLPFKHMNVPPPRNELFKWRKGAKRLSEWMVAGGLVPFDDGIINQQPPSLVDPPPLQARREQARAAMWSRVAARASTWRRMSNAVEAGDDARFTRDVADSVMAESRQGGVSRGDGGNDEEDSEDEMVRQLELEMEDQQREQGGGRSRQGTEPPPRPLEPQRELDDDDVLAILWAQLQRDAPELTRPDGAQGP